MNKMLGLIIVLSLLWIGAANTLYPPDQAATEKPQVHLKAPSFTLPSWQGKTLSIADAEGKPLVINFWASWCGPCKDEIPVLNSLYQKHHNQFQLYGVNLTDTDTMGAMKAFMRDYEITYPVLLDKKGKVQNMYNVNAFPTTYLINADGTIVKKMKGFAGGDRLKEEIKALISN